jgi:hypothetical protein
MLTDIPWTVLASIALPALFGVLGLWAMLWPDHARRFLRRPWTLGRKPRRGGLYFPGMNDPKPHDDDHGWTRIWPRR